MEQWPLLLAGPIVRRVEAGAVSVWVALKQAQRVELAVWQGVTNAGTGDGMFNGPAPLFTGEADTVRVGANLHLAVVTATPDGALTAGQTYAYNVAFGSPGGAPGDDLKSLGLLRDRAATTSGAGARLAHVALGYETNQLPTFVMPPPELDGLRIAHGSCRRPHADVPDMLPALDELIRANRGVVTQRPQQLFLTGDQIYADDVAPGLLHLLTPIGNDLLGTVEQLPTRWHLPPGEGEPRAEPAVRSRLPAGLRKALVHDDARLTTGDGHSHLLSCGEFLAMHLMCWSNELWPVALPSYADLFWGETLPAGEFAKVLAGETLPPDIWRLHTGLGVDTKHGLTARFPTEPDEFTPAQVAAVLARVAADASAERAFAEQVEVIAAFRDGLPSARRALANIATYMICDDHEVTDDWNLSELWRDRVFTSPLGRTVLRNGMLAYTLCQAWGNDPGPFATADTAPRRLLDAAARLFPDGDAEPPARTAADDLDTLFGLDGGDPPLRLNYSVSGPKHRVVVLDVRTRRAFAHRVSAPSNLSARALNEQIPEGPLPPGLEVLFVVSPLPVFGLPVIDEVAGAVAYRAFDAMKHSDIAGMPGTNPDAIEAWVQDPVTFEALLKRLAPYRRVIVLSGDVHYAHSGEASYWRKADQAPSRFAQFTSSGIKNVWPHAVLTISRSFAFTQALERLGSPAELLGWDADSPPPLAVPDGVDVLPPARARLRRQPVLLPSHGWPEGTTLDRAPDWTWRFRLSRDRRAITELPEFARPGPVGSDPAADATLDVEGYRRAAGRHAAQLDKVGHTRQVLFDSNVGVVHFDRAEGRLRVHHELHARPAGTDQAAVLTAHTVVLAPSPDDPAEERPAIGVTS